MELPVAKDKFIQAWGGFGSQWGINRSMAQVHALLLVSPDPLSTEDVMDQLNISRGNANMNLRALIDWNGPAVAIDDAALARVPFHDPLDRPPAILPGQYGKRKVGPVEAADEGGGLVHLQVVPDIRSHRLVRRGGKCDHRNVGEPAFKDGELLVLRPEMMPPAADAVGFINSDQGNSQFLQAFKEALLEQPFRGDIEQLDAPLMQLLEDPLLFVIGK